MGTGRPTEWVAETIRTVLNHRYTYSKHTILSTNLQIQSTKKTELPIKSNSLVEKIGVSIYKPTEIISLFNNGTNFITGDLENLISKIQSINVATDKKIDTNKSIYFDEVEISNKYLDFFTSSNK